MTDTPETYRQVAGAFREARDCAKTQRDQLIAAGNSFMNNAQRDVQLGTSYSEHLAVRHYDGCTRF
jgi:hypothetical protein